MKKSLLALLLSCLLLAAVFSGCSTGTEAPKEKKLCVITTIFPLYDWVREIVGDRADQIETILLLDNGADLHSYQPTVADVAKIGSCDVFIYVGGTSDQWVEDVLRQATNPNIKVVNLMTLLGDAVKEEELTEGMQEEHDHGDEGQEEDGGPHVHTEGPEYDEHIWLSVQNAAAVCRALGGILGEADMENADAYTANANAYIAKLNDLDARYRAAVDAAPVKTVLFGDRFPFRYLTDDYGLTYYAAFTGCSAETEASFETIAFLAGKVDELGLRAILRLESSDGSIARTIRDTTRTGDQEILTMNSLQSVTNGAVRDGVTYLEIMEQNLETLKQALQESR